MTHALDLRRRRSALRYWPAVLVRAGRAALEHDVPMLASALAYSTFFAVPATLLVVVGVFSLVADPGMIGGLMERLATIAPADAVSLLESSLVRLEERPSAGVAMTLVGFVLALWTTTGAMTTAMTAINRARDREDRRGFVRRRVLALGLALCFGSVALLVTVLLVLGPHLERWVGRALGAETAVAWIWWSAQWPVLLAGLFGAFAMVFALATDGGRRRWRLFSAGAVVAVVVWLAASAGFSVYVSQFGTYNKTWGSLSGAIVLLTWLWLSSLALLYGAEVDAEAERAR
ncbi:MAG: YihY/virulence factor BrkB family protein [Gaiellaceae bacterium]